MNILITDGVGKRKLRMVTVFCHSDQARVEPSVVLLTLIQWDSHDLAIIGDEDLHQFFLLPMGVFWHLFPRQSHPALGCVNYPISTFTVIPVLAASLYPLSGHPTQGGRKWADIFPNHQEGTVGELPWWIQFIILGVTLTAVTLGPSHIPQHLQREGFTDWWKTSTSVWLWCCCKLITQVKSQLEQELLCKQHAAEHEGRQDDCQGDQEDFSPCHCQAEGTVCRQKGWPLQA